MRSRRKKCETYIPRVEGQGSVMRDGAHSTCGCVVASLNNNGSSEQIACTPAVIPGRSAETPCAGAGWQTRLLQYRAAFSEPPKCTYLLCSSLKACRGGGGGSRRHQGRPPIKEWRWPASPRGMTYANP